MTDLACCHLKICSFRATGHFFSKVWRAIDGSKNAFAVPMDAVPMDAAIFQKEYDKFRHPVYHSARMSTTAERK